MKNKCTSSGRVREGSRLSVLHAPVNVGNHPWHLSRAERDLGADSVLAVNYRTWLGYPCDIQIGELGKRRPLNVLKRLGYGIYAPFRYDVLHYYFGKTLLCWDDLSRPLPFWFKDMALARALGKKIFMTLQGCDVRMAGESDRRNEITMCREGACESFSVCARSYDRQRRRLVNKILPRTDRSFYLNPELGHYAPMGQFLPYANVDVEAVKPIPPRTGGEIRVLHAPTNPAIKGSALINEALEELSKSFPIRLITVRDMPHAEAVKAYGQADLAIDQVLAGWYGGFAVEMMAMAKPVAAYIREEDLDFLPPGMRRALPIAQIHPKTLTRDLARIFESRDQWPELGERSRAFALAWHNPRTIAAAMIRAYCDPESRFTLTCA